jgi:hypothetical protein
MKDCVASNKDIALDYQGSFAARSTAANNNIISAAASTTRRLLSEPSICSLKLFGARLPQKVVVQKEQMTKNETTIFPPPSRRPQKLRISSSCFLANIRCKDKEEE